MNSKEKEHMRKAKELRRRLLVGAFSLVLALGIFGIGFWMTGISGYAAAQATVTAPNGAKIRQDAAHRLTAQTVSSAWAQTFVHLGNHFIILLLLRFGLAGCHVFEKLALNEPPRLAAGILVCRYDSGASLFIESVLGLSE